MPHLHAGTSTGSILASYLATKGAYTADNILHSDEYSAGMAKIRRALTRQGQQQAGADTDAARRDVHRPGEFALLFTAQNGLLQLSEASTGTP